MPKSVRSRGPCNGAYDTRHSGFPEGWKASLPPHGTGSLAPLGSISLESSSAPEEIVNESMNKRKIQHAIRERRVSCEGNS